MAFCILIFWNYFRGGHKRAEKVAVYYTLFAMGFFIFSIIMWAVAAGILQGARTNGHRKDIWGWSCVDSHRRELFQEKVDYGLVCRMQVSFNPVLIFSWFFLTSFLVLGFSLLSH